jgi:hypothetical protein
MVNMPDLQRRQRDVQEKTALLRSAMEAAQGLVDKDNRLQPVDR